MSTNTNTPRTDEFNQFRRTIQEHTAFESALETELAAAQNQVAAMREALREAERTLAYGVQNRSFDFDIVHYSANRNELQKWRQECQITQGIVSKALASTPATDWRKVAEGHEAAIKEALEMAVGHRFSTAIGYRLDADRCDKSDNETIRRRSIDLRERADKFHAEGGAFKQALAAFEAATKSNTKQTIP